MVRVECFFSLNICAGLHMSTIYGGGHHHTLLYICIGRDTVSDSIFHVTADIHANIEKILSRRILRRARRKTFFKIRQIKNGLSFYLVLKKRKIIVIQSKGTL